MGGLHCFPARIEGSSDGGRHRPDCIALGSQTIRHPGMCWGAPRTRCMGGSLLCKFCLFSMLCLCFFEALKRCTLLAFSWRDRTRAAMESLFLLCLVGPPDLLLARRACCGGCVM